MPAQDTKIPTVKRTRINRSKFIGRGDDREELRSIHGSLSTLAGHVRANKKSVAINARKITILKNIEKLKRDPVGAKLPGGGGLAETLGSIAATVESIKNTLIGQQEVDEEAIKDEEQDAETAARAKQENKLESKIFSTLKTQGEKVIAPVKSLWGKIWDFFVKLFAGKVFMNVLEWFGDEKNTDKIKSMIRFVGDWWPAILGSIGVLLGGLLIVGGGPIAMMIGAAMFLAGALTPVIAALGIFGGGDAKKLEQRKKDLEKGLNDVDDDDGGGGEQNVNVEDQIQTDEEVLNEVNFFNKGGQVPGSGNTDSVPAMLTPGEFVMSKGAVQQYGANTLAGMNAAAGGTNRPTVGRYEGGGMVDNTSKNSFQYVKGGSRNAISSQNLGGPRIHYNGGGIVNMNRFGSNKSTLPRIPVQYFKGGGLVADGYDKSPKEAAASVESGDKKKSPLGKAANLGKRLLKFLTPFGAIPFVGKKIVSMGGELVSGVEELIVGYHEKMHSDSAAQVAKGKPVLDPVNPPSRPGSPATPQDPVAKVNAQSSVQTAPSQELPNFNASSMRSGSKIKTLGIMV